MCDTFVALPEMTADGSTLFGKNSDREPNEAQNLEYFPGRTFAAGETLQTTYLAIPQVKETYGTIICRPFWMWGAEMGANEKGVVIGNEAVFTRMPVEKKEVLTGMDLLRLALERAASASQALETIVKLISDFGQGGICGYKDKHLRYHNSFIIADPDEAWVLETAGKLWAALKVKDFYTISNGLTIGESFDLSHPELIQTAQKKGWLKKGRTFNFKHCLSDWFYTTFSASRTRRNRGMELLVAKKTNMDTAAAMAHLRDHRSDEQYRPDGHFLMNTICAHAANKLSRNAAQTTGSFIAHLKQDVHTFWATGTAAPCTGIFKPIWFEGEVLPDINSLWWRHEGLHRLILIDYKQRLNTFCKERDGLEAQFMAKALPARAGKREGITRSAFKQADAKTTEWIKKIQGLPISHRPRLLYRHYWRAQNKKAGVAEKYK
jgi:dipeptidase